MLLRICLASFLLFCASIEARGTNRQDEWQAFLQDLRHEVRNLSIEIQTLDRKITTQDEAILQLQTQWSNQDTKSQESFRSNWQALNQQLKQMQGHIEALAEFQNSLKEYEQQKGSVVEGSQKKIASLEQQTKKQNENISHLQDSLKIVMNLLKGSETSLEEGMVFYEVRSGDSLEKIARRHQTTIETLKKDNHLTSDRILIGQKLKIRKT